MVSFSSSVSRCDIGEVLPCNGGVIIIRKRTINPLGLQPLPLYFLAENTWGEKVTLRVCFYEPCLMYLMSLCL